MKRKLFKKTKFGRKVADANPGENTRIPKVKLAWLAFRAYKQMDFEKLKSRKLWATVLAAVLQLVGEAVGIDPGVVDKISGILMFYVAGQALDDHGSKAKLRTLKFETERKFNN